MAKNFSHLYNSLPQESRNIVETRVAAIQKDIDVADPAINKSPDLFKTHERDTAYPSTNNSPNKVCANA